MLEVMRGIRSVGECMCGPGMNEVCVKERAKKIRLTEKRAAGGEKEIKLYCRFPVLSSVS